MLEAMADGERCKRYQAQRRIGETESARRHDEDCVFMRYDVVVVASVQRADEYVRVLSVCRRATTLAFVVEVQRIQGSRASSVRMW